MKPSLLSLILASTTIVAISCGSHGLNSSIMEPMSTKNLHYHMAKDSTFQDFYDGLSFIRECLSETDIAKYSPITYKQLLSYTADSEDGPFKTKAYNRAAKEYVRKYPYYNDLLEKADSIVLSYKDKARTINPADYVAITYEGTRDEPVFFFYQKVFRIGITPVENAQVQAIKVFFHAADSLNADETCQGTITVQGGNKNSTVRSVAMDSDAKHFFKYHEHPNVNIFLQDVKLGNNYQKAEWLFSNLEQEVPASIKQSVFNNGYTPMTWKDELTHEEKQAIINELLDPDYISLEKYQEDYYEQALEKKYPLVTEFLDE